jgi:4-hydroxy 2-oxovalerate aldolase
MLSGMLQCHASYAKELVEMKEYTIEDVWRALDYIKKQNPVGFSKKVLDDVIAKGIIGGIAEDKSTESMVSTGKQAADIHLIQDVPYIDRHKDRDFLILANGPTIKQYKPQIDRFITKNEPIVMGANYLGKLFKPHYHAFNNKRRFTEYIDSVDADSKLLIGRYIPDEMIREYTARPYEKIYYKDVINPDFNIINGEIQTNCRTIAVLLIGVAIVMGAKRVFAVGMDGYLNTGTATPLHFYEERHEKEDREKIIELHRWCQRFIEEIDRYLISLGKEGFHILTPTSYKLFYKGIENYI